jgi:hypothetical protein
MLYYILGLVENSWLALVAREGTQIKVVKPILQAAPTNL